MTVSELIAILQTMPQDLPVEVNDNNGGQIHLVDQVDCFTAEDVACFDVDDNYPCVMIQVNCNFE